MNILKLGEPSLTSSSSAGKKAVREIGDDLMQAPVDDGFLVGAVVPLLV